MVIFLHARNRRVGLPRLLFYVRGGMVMKCSSIFTEQWTSGPLNIPRNVHGYQTVADTYHQAAFLVGKAVVWLAQKAASPISKLGSVI